MHTLVGSASAKEVLLWDPSTLQVQLTQSPGCSALAATLGGLLGLGKRQVLHYWEGKEAAERQQFERQFSCLAAWRHVVVAGTQKGELWVWDHAVNWLRISGQSAISALAVSEQLVVVGKESGAVEEYTLADLYCGGLSPRFTYKQHTQTVTALSLLHGQVVSASLDGTVIRGAVGSVVEKNSLNLSVTALAACDTAIYVGSQEGAVQKLGNSETWHWQDHSISALLLLDPQRLLVCTDLITVLDTATGTPIQVFTSHTSPPTSLTLIPQSSDSQLCTLSPVLASASSVSLPPGPAVQAPVTKEEELPKLQAMNHWLYGVWVDAWL